MNRVEHSSLAVGKPLGTGRSARVRQLDPDPGVVYKQYHREVVGRYSSESLEQLISWREGLSSANRLWVDDHLAWPRGLVENLGSFMGITVTSAPAEFMVGTSGTATFVNDLSRIRDLAGEIGPNSVVEAGPSPDERLKLAQAMADLMKFFESHGLIHHELVPMNILWSLSPAPRLFLLGCDAVTLGGAAPQFPTRSLGVWGDPRVSDRLVGYADIESNRLSLAVFIYVALFGEEPFTTGARALRKPPGAALYPDDVWVLLEDSLTTVGPRPSAAAWIRVLRACADRREPEDSVEEGPSASLGLSQTSLDAPAALHDSPAGLSPVRRSTGINPSPPSPSPKPSLPEHSPGQDRASLRIPPVAIVFLAAFVLSSAVAFLIAILS